MTIHKIESYLINEKKKILDALKKFDSNRENLLIVVDDSKKFRGIITISDLRRAFINGFTLSHKITNFINRNPVVIEQEKNNEDFASKIDISKLQNIDPPLIPIINNKKIPIKLIEKDNLKFINSSKKKKKQSILLIGGAGYIGNPVCKKLLAEGHDVTIFDKFIYNSKKEVEKFHNNKNLNLINGDTRNLSSIYEAIKNHNVVIHLAEMVGDPLCEISPERTYEVNFLASITIANICKNLELDKFIYISSCSVYGSSNKNLLSEKSKLNPLTVYAKLKNICEKAISNNSGSSLKPCILRLGTVYGNSLRQRYDLVINLFSALTGNKKKIAINGGNQWRPFIHVDDIGEAIKQIINSPNSKVNGQIFNIVGENLKISQIGNIFKKLYPSVKIIISNENRDMRNYRVSSKKAKQIINFIPKKFVKKEIPKIVSKVIKNKIKNIKSKKYINYLNVDRFN